MQDLDSKVAFITGGASGIGLALARACGIEGMRVMLGDIDSNALDSAVAQLRDEQIDADAVLCDVTSEDSLRQAAQATVERFGKVHLLINNAGVLAYSATKHAVVGYSEALADQLKDENIGVSALCPGFTKTRIAETERFDGNRESAAGKDSGFVDAVDAGMSPDVVARFALEQVQQNALYIFSHPGTRGEIVERWRVISAAFDRADASEVINSDPDAQRIAVKEDMSDLYR